MILMSSGRSLRFNLASEEFQPASEKVPGRGRFSGSETGQKINLEKDSKCA